MKQKDGLCRFSIWIGSTRRGGSWATRRTPTLRERFYECHPTRKLEVVTLMGGGPCTVLCKFQNEDWRYVYIQEYRGSGHLAMNRRGLQKKSSNIEVWTVLGSNLNIVACMFCLGKSAIGHWTWNITFRFQLWSTGITVNSSASSEIWQKWSGMSEWTGYNYEVMTQ